ncbi:MAG: hypothetical protein Q4D46_08530 [Erysipelotrichaceae bacterium]|nr:hypothetical protein [Solobacterium sp.]MCR5449126.1 hypothetical protein [Solobacterium sp.]MDO5122106.1 hypothetical protein [Erysipelotrichaceae bacterium]
MKKTILTVFSIILTAAGIAFAFLMGRAVYLNGIENKRLLLLCASLAVSAMGADLLAKAQIPREVRKQYRDL